MEPILTGNNDEQVSANLFYFNDPMFVCEGYNNPGWYFWDEAEISLIGPFPSESRANTAYSVYFSNI